MIPFIQLYPAWMRQFYCCLRVLCIIALGSLLAVPEAVAMSKTPKQRDHAQPLEIVSPEIEIITRPDPDRNFFPEKPPARKRMVAPQEVIPAVGSGSTGEISKYRTKDVQTALKNAGFDPGPIDGVPGSKTKKAIRAFQRTHNLIADGIVGKKTWAALEACRPAEKNQMGKH